MSADGLALSGAAAIRRSRSPGRSTTDGNCRRRTPEPARPATVRPDPTPAVRRRRRIDRFEATLPASPAAPATARAALTRWLSGHVPIEVLDGRATARLRADQQQPPSAGHLRGRLAAARGPAQEGALRVEVRDPGTTEWSPRASRGSCSSSTASPRAGASTAQAGRTCGSRSTPAGGLGAAPSPRLGGG